MNEKIIELGEIAERVNQGTHFSRMADNYICLRYNRPGSETKFDDLRIPARLACLTIVLVRHGCMCAEVDLIPYQIRANTLIIINPGSLFSISSIDPERLDVSIMFVSTSFLLDINIDLNALDIRSLIEKRTPAVRLLPAQVQKLMRYYDLLDIHSRDEVTLFSTNVARSLCAAIFYELLQINYLRIDRQVNSAVSTRRRSTYVHDFMRLVHFNYKSHRTLGFYAGKLYISPKYLTVLVKEATGRSATEWIDEFVIIEAKNLLRFSGKNIQQVAYALNFPNQSSFGKYFKRLTGISPMAYQKG
ncbi:MAG: helix-turn-helix domain-containing protein [Bacteroidales bacterium]|nr:helix-turn-helix domain-containing protein [Bacteroidales bacterium]